jgi:hypothetical protein
VVLNFLLYSGMKKAEMRKNRLLSMGSRTRSTSLASTSEMVILGTAVKDLHVGRRRSRWERIYEGYTFDNNIIVNMIKLLSMYTLLHKRDAKSTTMMLIIVIALFLCTEIPLMAITLLHVLSTK